MSSEENPFNNSRSRNVSAKIMLEYSGDFGRFQKLLVASICVMNFFVSQQLTINYFMSIVPSWKCRINSTVCTSSRTFTGNDNSRCKIARTEWFYIEQKHYSLITEFDLDCRNSWLSSLFMSIHFVGYGIGSIVIGYGGDKYGRKALLFPSFYIMMVVSWITSFIQDIYLIIVCRFITGFFIPGITTLGNILLAEFVGDKSRPYATMFPFILLSIGYCILDFNAYMLKNWRSLMSVSTLPSILIIPLYFFIPESAFWLHSNGENIKAMNVFLKVARWNKNFLPKDMQLQLITIPPDKMMDNQYKDLEKDAVKGFKSPKILIQTIIMSFIWFSAVLNFYGLLLGAEDLGGGAYLDFLFISSAQIPSGILAIVLSSRFGRKLANIFPLFLAGVLCTCITLVPNRKDVRVILGTICGFFVTITVEALYLWSSELFPVQIRSMAMSTAQLAARIGATCAPWVVNGFKAYGESVPYIVLGVPSLIAVFCGIYLPETVTKEKRQPRIKSSATSEESKSLLRGHSKNDSQLK